VDRRRADRLGGASRRSGDGRERRRRLRPLTCCSPRARFADDALFRRSVPRPASRPKGIDGALHCP
jgi:hypothetical protein